PRPPRHRRGVVSPAVHRGNAADRGRVGRPVPRGPVPRRFRRAPRGGDRPLAAPPTRADAGSAETALVVADPLYLLRPRVRDPLPVALAAARPRPAVCPVSGTASGSGDPKRNGMARGGGHPRRRVPRDHRAGGDCRPCRLAPSWDGGARTRGGLRRQARRTPRRGGRRPGCDSRARTRGGCAVRDPRVLPSILPAPRGSRAYRPGRPDPAGTRLSRRGAAPPVPARVGAVDVPLLGAPGPR